MKKTILTTLALTLTILTFAQIPSGFSAAYLFNNGSLANCGASSAQDLANFTTSGSVSETKNRKGTDGQAISISSGNSLVRGVNLQCYLDEFCYKLNRRYFGDRLFDRITIALASSLCIHAD